MASVIFANIFQMAYLLVGEFTKILLVRPIGYYFALIELTCLEKAWFILISK